MKASNLVPLVKARCSGAEALHDQTVQIKLKVLITKQPLFGIRHASQNRLRTTPLMNCSDKYGFGSLFGSNTKHINTKSPGLGAQGAGVFNRWAARLN